MKNAAASFFSRQWGLRTPRPGGHTGQCYSLNGDNGDGTVKTVPRSRKCMTLHTGPPYGIRQIKRQAAAYKNAVACLYFEETGGSRSPHPVWLCRINQGFLRSISNGTVGTPSGVGGSLSNAQPVSRVGVRSTNSLPQPPNSSPSVNAPGNFAS